MDFFGFGAAMRAAAQLVRTAQRGSGRTTSLVDSLKTGDRVLVATAMSGNRLVSLCKERDVEITVVVTSVDNLRQTVHSLGSSPGEGRTIIDHVLVEDIYAHAVEAAISDIDAIEKRLSGYGATHRETRRRAEEMMKWRL